MGYNTYYKLQCVNADIYHDDDFREDFKSVTQYDMGDFSGTHTWYDWEKDMVALSKMYPTYQMELHGVGEEFPDVWKAYFLAGKCEVRKIKYTFDMNTLWGS
jgi:hypothetical protein